MANTIRILLSDSFDPYFNLAVEDAIFRNMSTEKRILFLWRNKDTVVIGKGQNPWRECNTAQMEKDGVKLARRKSGGGAVFHDKGNTNFTLMGGKPEFDKAISTQIVLDALQSIGINGKSTGRNDLVVETDDGDRKFSGSAYRELKDRGFHHGTLLLNADLSRLANYLNPDPKKLQAKGIASVRSRVINLCELDPAINHESACAAIERKFMEYFDEQAQPEVISPQSMPDLPGFAEVYEKQKEWDWNFGKALGFSHTLEERFAWGGVEVHLDVREGKIVESRIFTDCLYPELLESVAKQMVGKRYNATELCEVVAEVASQNEGHRSDFEELQQWMESEIS